MKKIVIFVLLILMISLPGYTGPVEDIDRMVAELDKSELNRLDAYTSGKVPLFSGYGHSIYFDQNNRIRKYTDQTYSRRMVIYFTPQGATCLFLYYASMNLDESFYAYNGKVYFHKGRIIKIDSIETTKLYSDDKNHIYYDPPKVITLKNRMPTNKNFFPKYFKTTHDIIKLYINSEYTTYSGYAERKTTPPAVGDETYISANNVLVRPEPSTSKPALNKLHILDDITILEVEKKETIKPYGTYHWYKVNFRDMIKGYVFGAFIYPMEMNVKVIKLDDKVEHKITDLK